MEHIYLTRRNLASLLNKLDRNRAGGNSAVTIIKRDVQHPIFPQSCPAVAITAVEDEVYYDRRPGEVLAADEPTSGYLPPDVERFLRLMIEYPDWQDHHCRAGAILKAYGKEVPSEG